MKEKIGIIIFFVLVICIVILFPSLNNNYIKTGKLYISEIMANNTHTIKDDDGDFSDYIEIYNDYNYKINLKSYYLSDNEFEIDKWQFPNIEIESKEYLLLYASGKNKCDLQSRVCHTNFKLSSDGETITLSDNNGNIINKFSYSKLDSDISFGYKNRKYITFDVATPGKENTGRQLKVDNKNYDIYINEYMTHNTYANYTESGYYYDFVELYNAGDTVTIGSLYLSDDINKLDKYRIPSIEIEKDGYLVVYLSGENDALDDGIYANFKLSDDEYLILSDGNKIIDKVEIVSLYDNISYGRIDGKWKYFPTSTPGRVNDTIFFDNMGGNNGST